MAYLYGTSNQSLAQPSNGMYNCQTCGKLFMHRRTLKRHEQTHTTASNFSCLECGKSYSQAYDLERHSRLHRGDRPFRCQVCSRTFSMSHHLTNHMVTHTGVRAYSCLVCSKSFAQTFSLKRHMRMHLRLADAGSTAENPASGFVLDGMALLRSLSCRACGKVFSTAQTLNRHRCIQDSDANAPQRLVELQNGAEAQALCTNRLRVHRCTECGAEFSTLRLYNEHVASVHRGQPDKPYACTDCTKRFAHPYSLKRHRVEHGGNAHVCPTCAKRFAQLSELDRHLKSHRASTAEEQKVATCGVCLRVSARCFTVPQPLMDQLAVHGFNRAPCCDDCLRGFIPSFTLKQSDTIVGEPQIVTEPESNVEVGTE